MQLGWNQGRLFKFNNIHNYTRYHEKNSSYNFMKWRSAYFLILLKSCDWWLWFMITYNKQNNMFYKKLFINFIGIQILCKTPVILQSTNFSKHIIHFLIIIIPGYSCQRKRKPCQTEEIVRHQKIRMQYNIGLQSLPYHCTTSNFKTNLQLF